MLGIISFQNKVTNSLFTGFSIKAARSELAEMESAYTYAADVGLFILPTRNVSISAALQNLGGATKFIDSDTPLPTAGYIGSGITLNMGSLYLLPSAGVTYYIEDAELMPEVGVEAGCSLLSLNMGYRNSADDFKLHVGTRITLKNMVFGYAYIPSNYLDTTHRLTLSYRFKVL
jgi:hypothetical protein